MFKEHLRTIAIVLPIVLIARYFVFRDKAEFGLFFAGLKTYVAPLGIALSLIMIGGILYVVANKVDHPRQKQLADTFFWVSSALLAIAVVAISVLVKIRPAVLQ